MQHRLDTEKVSSHTWSHSTEVTLLQNNEAYSFFFFFNFGATYSFVDFSPAFQFQQLKGMKN